jgi:3-oxoadipate enol-lactonase / 4-carboxymuconolactone decarboxylase
MNFVTLNGITLHYGREGASSGVPLVFIHSLGCDLHIWDGVVPSLSDDYPIVRFDLRGHGLSDAPPAPYAMRDLASDVVGLLDHLHIEQAILVGVSMGGMVALQTALDFPKRVQALILCDMAARIGTGDYWDDRINTLREHGIAYLADTILSRWFAPEFIENNPAIYRGFYNLLTRTPLEGYIGTCAALRDTDLNDRLVEISVPALVVCGAGDVSVPPHTARAFADSLPNSHFQLIENAAHLPSVEQPEAVAHAIIQFLNTVSPQDQYEIGMRVRRAVLGDAHVDRAEANKTAFDADFQRFITETAWGSVWARPGLDRVTRHLLTITILAALGREHELALHIRATQNTGVTPEELREALLHVAVYAGIPAANTAFSTAKKVYAESDLAPPEDKHP